MDRHTPGLRWYEHPDYECVRDCIQAIPENLETIESTKSSLLAAPSAAAAASIAARIPKELTEIATGYRDIQAALQSFNDNYRWALFPGLHSLVQKVADITWDDLDQAPGGPYWFSIPKPSFITIGTPRLTPAPQAPHGRQRISLSHETMTHMERMRSVLENHMKGVLKDAFDSLELRPIYTKAFKDRCFAAIERGDFVPLESFMCDTGEKDLRKKTLPEALMDCRKSRLSTAARAIASARDLFSVDFVNNVPKDASHLCHQKIYDLFWHIVGEPRADKIHRKKWIQILAWTIRIGEAFPLDGCWCGDNPHCLLGPAALTQEEVKAYQWMAANNYASFGEIPFEALAGMENLTKETLGSVFTTWKMEFVDDGENLRSRWAVPVISKTLADLYQERVDAAKKRDLIQDNQSEATE